MCPRALLAVAVLAAVALATGAGGASAATLFANTPHTASVVPGATADATSVGTVRFTAADGLPYINCPHMNLSLRVDDNGAVSERVAITVTNVAVAPPCVGSGNIQPTTTTPWLLTVTGAGTMIGTETSYAATVHNVRFDVNGLGVHTGNLETGVTAVQPTVATSPICIVAEAAGGITVDALQRQTPLDARFCLTGPAAGWSLG